MREVTGPSGQEFLDKELQQVVQRRRSIGSGAI